MYDCRACKHYAEFKDHFNYAAEGYPDGVSVFGVCYKNFRNHICYPVYIPDGGVCKDFKKKSILDVAVEPKEIASASHSYIKKLYIGLYTDWYLEGSVGKVLFVAYSETDALAMLNDAYPEYDLNGLHRTPGIMYALDVNGEGSVIEIIEFKV